MIANILVAAYLVIALAVCVLVFLFCGGLLADETMDEMEFMPLDAEV